MWLWPLRLGPPLTALLAMACWSGASSGAMLIEAARLGDAARVAKLLDRGADPLARDASGYRAFDYAIERRHVAVVRVMLRGPQRAVYLAALDGDTAALASAVAQGSDIDAEHAAGYAALPLAARFGHAEAVDLLLRAGADPNRPTASRFGSTPLMEATRDGHQEIVRLLLQADADVNRKDREGDHALNWAVFFGHVDLVRLLLNAGAAPDVRGQTNETAAEIAARRGFAEIERLLLDHAGGARQRADISGAVTGTRQSRATVRRLTPVLRVDAIESCLPFWTEGLGFAVTASVPDGERLGFAVLQKDDVELMFQTRASLARDVPAAAGGGGPVLLYLEVGGLDELARSLAGYEVVVAKRQTSYGAVEIFYRAPCDVIVGFAESAR